MLLLSGDIQLNPGPSINSTGHEAIIGTGTCQGVDTQLNTMIAGSLEPSLIPTGTSDCFNLVPTRRPNPLAQDSSTCTITPPSAAGQIQRKNGPQQSSFPAKRCEIF